MCIYRSQGEHVRSRAVLPPHALRCCSTGSCIKAASHKMAPQSTAPHDIGGSCHTARQCAGQVTDTKCIYEKQVSLDLMFVFLFFFEFSSQHLNMLETEFSLFSLEVQHHLRTGYQSCCYQWLKVTSPYTTRSPQHSQSWEIQDYFTWLLYDTTTLIIPTMITVATLLLIGRDAARDLGVGGRNAGAVVDVAGRSLSLAQDAVSQRLAALKLKHKWQGVVRWHEAAVMSRSWSKLTSGAFRPSSR